MRKKNIFCLMLDEFQLKVLSKYSNGISRMSCFSYLVLHAMRETTIHTKRGISYTVPQGCLDTSEEELASLWQCNRTTVHRILKEWEENGLISISANNVTTIVSVISLQSWYVGKSPSGSFPRNSAFRYPIIDTDRAEEDLVPVRKLNIAATDKKSSSRKKASKASKSADTDNEARYGVGTEETSESAVTSVTTSQTKDDNLSGLVPNGSSTSGSNNLAVDTVKVSDSGATNHSKI